MSAPDLVLVLVRLAIGCWLLWSVRTVVRFHGGIDLGHVSVVVPARNEASTLPTLLNSLPPGVEVVEVGS